MTEDLQNVYRERVLDHSRNPHNFGKPDLAELSATGHNPLCGDKLTVYLNLDEDTISNAAFEGSGCAISLASASMMTDLLKGLSIKDANDMIEAARCMLNEDQDDLPAALKDFRALEGVRAYPSRIKCATLAWTAAEAALHNPDNKTQHVSTE